TNNSLVDEWVGIAKKELFVKDTWANDLMQWAKGNKYYKGSGWAHGVRQGISDALGLDGEAHNLVEVGIKSMLQHHEIVLDNSPRLLQKINEDPAMVQYEKKLLLNHVLKHPKYGKEDFRNDEKIRSSLQLGGKRASGEMFDQFLQFYHPKNFATWKVALNELTWLLRSIAVETKIRVNSTGEVRFTHEFSDTFDLRPSGQDSRETYDVITLVLGFVYHDIAGGNDLMKIRAKWTNVYSKAQIIEKTRTAEELAKMEAEKNKYRRRRLHEARDNWANVHRNNNPTKN
ncbi:MAG: hypothetical protein OIF50_07030, partial [Flavobacteriaceae bacterium]|nr:hypothetical protein [Flavobacteriaceae bacterium]